MTKYRHSSIILRLAVLSLVGTMQAIAASGDPPIRVARLAQLAGQISLEPAETNQWTQAAINTPLTTGDRLYVDQSGHAELQMARMAVRAGRYTDLLVVNLANTITQLGLAQGTLHVRTFELDPSSNVEIDTPNGAITVVQPGDVRIDAYMADGGTLVTVKSGEVQITGPKLSQVLGAGQSVHLVGSHPITVLPQPMPGEDPFDVWSLQRDRAFLSSKSRDYVNAGTIGSEDLDRYGTWTQTLEYGPVWYPANVPAGWTPYSSGRWVWISPWGWTWVDTYAWGFAPFHYGRWTDLGLRWGWVPGPLGVAPIYSPAMVAFVGGAGFTNDAGAQLSGWFPLGPEEPLYPSYFCTSRYFTHVNLTNIGNRRRTMNASNYFRYYHTRIGLHSIRYINEKTGTIAVPLDEFAAGHAVTPATAVHPTAQQWTHAQILAHPLVAPTVQSLVPHPVSNSVPVPAERPTLVTVSQPQTASASGASAPNEQSQSQPNSDGGRSPLIVLTPPPPDSPSFALRQPAHSLDPGRPLDPGQLNNLSQGRPAGAPATAEFPPHHF